MNIVTDYTKKQLDRSSYISEDKYKRAFDLNRIRLIAQKLAGVDNKYTYYYNLTMFKKMIERLKKLGISVSDEIPQAKNKNIIDDEEQIKLAEKTWGKELIDSIIDTVLSDADSGEYDETTEEEIKKEAEDDASSDSDSGEYKMPPFDKNNPKDPITEKLEEEGKEKAEEIADNSKSGECDDTTKTEEVPSCGSDSGVSNEGCQMDNCSLVCDGCIGDCDDCILDCDSRIPDNCHVVCDDCKGNSGIPCDICLGDSRCPSDNCTVVCDGCYGVYGCSGDAKNEGCASVIPCDTPVCNEEPCNTPLCDELPCDTCTSDCCVSDIPCADTPPCGDTCGAGDYTPPPCDTCGGDSNGCPADCCVADCCVGNGQCSSDSTCTNNCDCCVNDSACTNVSCNGDMDCGSNCDCPSDCGSNCDGSGCDCGSDCDNYGYCIDACGGNE